MCLHHKDSLMCKYGNEPSIDTDYTKSQIKNHLKLNKTESTIIKDIHEKIQKTEISNLENKICRKLSDSMEFV